VNNKLTSATRPYFINGILLNNDNSVTDLGVLTDDNLSYKGHINIIVYRAMQRLGILFRACLCRDIKRVFLFYAIPFYLLSTLDLS